MVGGPPSHSAIKERWGPGLAVRGSPRRQSPHRHPNPKPDLENGRCQRRKAPPTPAPPSRRTRHRRGRHCTDSPSPPNIAAGAQMASANETSAGASTTTAFDGLLPLTPLLSASHVNLEHVFLSYIPDLVNLTRLSPKKSNNGTRATVRQEIRSGK